MMTTVAQRHRTASRYYRASGKPLRGLAVGAFAAMAILATGYISYVLWPRWPDAPIAGDPPSLPIAIAGSAFNVEPAAFRRAVQRQAGTQERVDLAYLWPSLLPADPAIKANTANNGAPIDPNARLFVTIESGDDDLPLMQRVQTIYPRYLASEPTAGPPGLTLRGFRDGTPYEGEELVFESQAPEHFLARCSLKGAVNAGICLLERRIGRAEVTVRFARDWLWDWKSLASDIDRLLARLHPAS